MVPDSGMENQYNHIRSYHSFRESEDWVCAGTVCRWAVNMCGKLWRMALGGEKREEYRGYG